MSALTDALAAAQARSLAALEKAYVAGKLDYEEMQQEMDAIGCSDDIDQDLLIFSLDVLKKYGVQAPGYSERRTTDKPTSAQVALIERLAKEKDFWPVDLTGVSRAQASEIIDTLKAGTFEPEKWTVPF